MRHALKLTRAVAAVLLACAAALAQEQRPVVTLLYNLNDEVAFADVTREDWEEWHKSFAEINRLDKEFRRRADELGQKLVALSCSGGGRRMQAEPFDFGKEMDEARERLRAGVGKQVAAMRGLAAGIREGERRKAALRRIDEIGRLYEPKEAARK